MKTHQIRIKNRNLLKISVFFKSFLKLPALVYLISLILMLLVYFYSESQEFVSDIPFKSDINNDFHSKTDESLILKKTKIFCMIHTYPGRFKSFLPATYHTWVRKCDNYRYISAFNPDDLPQNEADKLKKGENEIIYLNRFLILQPSGWTKENNQNLTEKNYYTFMEIYKRFPNYDWYLRADDDAFIFMEHLQNLLHGKDPKTLIGIGYKFIPSYKLQPYWLSSGAGYVLSNEAVNLLNSKLVKDINYCPRRDSQDQDMALCLNRLNVTIEEQADSMGLDRFHPFDLVGHMIGKLPNWVHHSIDNVFKIRHECCSPQTVSFNNLKPDEIYKLGYFYGQYLMAQGNKKNVSFHYVLKSMEIYSRYGHIQHDL